ncbi:TenA family protein [Labrys monachus]|uniref:Aminopyrimidine aminohydrolase n=1 Tax=Labrys monachus TaxID=217067 RepID=A0ABU0FID6_9HYPH|nr:TenA family protein [Labrys monachus]MDQ0394374.1 thiaminase/transcriptional activator TenA [Labrys monachus]
MLEQLLSDEILQANADVWEAMQHHRFVADIEADRLDPAVFRRYLVYENAFVETAISIFGHLLVKSPGLAEQHKLIQVLKALSEEQIAYFRETFEALGIPYADPATLDLPMPVLSFQQGMLSFAAHGAYVDGVAAMFAAEWMYWHWSRRVIAQPISEPVLRRWVALHTDEAFAAQARWLKDQLDAAGRSLDKAARKRISKVFRNALKFEIDFHSAPYSAAP